DQDRAAVHLAHPVDQSSHARAGEPEVELDLDTERSRAGKRMGGISLQHQDACLRPDVQRVQVRVWTGCMPCSQGCVHRGAKLTISAKWSWSPTSTSADVCSSRVAVMYSSSLARVSPTYTTRRRSPVASATARAPGDVAT